MFERTDQPYLKESYEIKSCNWIIKDFSLSTIAYDRLAPFLKKKSLHESYKNLPLWRAFPEVLEDCCNRTRRDFLKFYLT